MGDPARLRHGKQFRSFTGLTPKASETGETDRKGQPMSKAGSALLPTTLVRAADNARKQDPQLARIYYQQMTERGKDHLGALCVVAACLARTSLDCHALRQSLPHARHRRPARQRRAGQSGHRRELGRIPRDPRPPS
jgi:Transposase IS116/IS110/IS902 family